jgi:hypothetical protein
MKLLVDTCKQHIWQYTALVFSFGLTMGVMGTCLYFAKAIVEAN